MESPSNQGVFELQEILNLDEKALKSMDIKKLNRHLKKHGVEGDDDKLLRVTRRTLKNRDSAAVSRHRRAEADKKNLEAILTLESEMSTEAAGQRGLKNRSEDLQQQLLVNLSPDQIKRVRLEGAKFLESELETISD